MLFSIIIPVYNGERSLPRTLESILQQRNFLDNTEVLVINDASVDNTRTIVEQYIKDYSFIRLFNFEKNRRPGSARNFGIQESSGKYIVFCDADDLLAEDALSVVSDCLDKNKDLDVLECNYFLENDRGHLTENQYHPSAGTIIEKGEDYMIKYGVRGFTWARCYRRDFILKNNIRFSEGRTCGEDLIFSVKSFYYADKVMFINYPAVVYGYNPASVSRKVVDTNKIYEDILSINDISEWVSGMKILNDNIRKFTVKIVDHILRRNIKASLSLKYSQWRQLEAVLGSINLPIEIVKRLPFSRRCFLRCPHVFKNFVILSKPLHSIAFFFFHKFKR